MKKWIAWLLILCLPLAFYGCGAQQAAAQSDETDSDLIVVGYCQTGAESDWRVANSDSIRQAFSEENGYELLFVDAQSKQENQIRAIRSFIQQQVDYIVFSPITEDGWDEVLQEAKDAGIPVILTDRMANVSDSSLYAAYVGSDFRAEGVTAGQWLEKYLQAQGRQAETLHIVELQGTLGSSAQLGRTEGFADIQASHPNWTMDAQLCADFTNAKANEVMLQQLGTSGAPDVLICQNDDMAAGAMAAMDSLGIHYGAQGGVIVISFDATHAGLASCLAGGISLDVECNPLQGPDAERLVQLLEQGHTPPKVTYVDETEFDTSTMTASILENRAY